MDIVHQWPLSISLNPRRQTRLTTMVSLYHLANGNHYPDPLLHSALRSASLRFHESHRSAPLFLDPYCGCFLSPDTAPPSASTPYRLATKFIDDELMNRIMSDDELRQVVLFTDGMDTRPFRLNWPRSSAIYDVSPGSVFQFASQRLQDVGAKISRTCMLLHVPSESSNIQEHLCEKGFNGNRPSVWALQGLPLMSSACFNDLLFLVSCLAMKGSIFLGVLPGWLIGTEFGNMAATRKWMESLFMSHGFQVSIVSYAEVSRKLHLEPPTENLCSVLFVAEQLRFSDAQMERWRSEFDRLEDEGDEEGFEEL
ncbi:putative methyltransferase Ppm1/Ppm2/Tcmp, S-adenosyl-L-methionine-dependent methyltransferase [Dioscorea sansibarensis]